MEAGNTKFVLKDVVVDTIHIAKEDEYIVCKSPHAKGLDNIRLDIPDWRRNICGESSSRHDSRESNRWPIYEKVSSLLQLSLWQRRHIGQMEERDRAKLCEPASIQHA